ncbi:Set1 complex component ash2 [Schizosaccharomyces pombe]|uniref:Set1 complex component ash2 n=1 Tax=Schizosaccharomyces pombe (strain 972 / ATCC 24843) TaxID=284812 RepID=ASH2_SCHPO|nr:Ash2-trithorax family protein [Schizosaccharomyces pombe]O60070.1 RecName: Full=Set1 complex component ash2; Short=Set1C component ash2; AltName: Full=COMPASS component ash2; AltName: Full=Complex proteins associated with set1 protein ash2; AltName: Full=Lid2 complex component ash2; Short=Lid2C component ash2 [Schizosaccharomyces pombe 972h-]CAA18661.1 Ash2-trithorax family protein [Schizosaccharomyces pombe]|eukprot:NP_596557.1 Ash2-trithorax family protein [Schizosaccharomyces pombe]
MLAHGSNDYGVSLKGNKTGSSPSKASSLNWNEPHTLNEQNTYCYCGKDRNLRFPDLQCSVCLNMFHLSCLSPPCTSMMGFSTNYQFVCKHCTEDGFERFERGVSAWKAITATAMANLVVKRYVETNPDVPVDSFNAEKMRNFQANTYFFKKKEDLIPFIEEHWQLLCPDREKVQTWQATLGSCLVANRDTYRAKDETMRNQNSEYALNNPNLFDFRSGYIFPFQRVGATVPKKRLVETETPPPSSSKLKEDYKDSKREMKRSNTPWSNASIKKNEVPTVPIRYKPPPWRDSDFETVPKLPIFYPNSSSPNFFSLSEIPFNRRGFRYSPCEAAKDLPNVMYREIELPPFTSRINWHDISTPVFIDHSALCATVEKGFRMARSNVFMTSGEWYFEIKIEKGGGDDGAHVRIGVSRREAPLDAPVGYDAYSYGLRDLGGQKVHMSRPRNFMDSFGTGDIIGLHISLPKPSFAQHTTLPSCHDRIPIRYKGQLYFEQPDYVPSKMMDELMIPSKHNRYIDLPYIPGSFIKVYKNGSYMGTAFENLLDFNPPNSINSNHYSFDDGSLGYYPSISMYGGGIARFQFGPQFSHRPLVLGSNVRPVSERYNEQIAEDVLCDILDEIDYAEDPNTSSVTIDVPQEPNAGITIIPEIKDITE